MILRLALPCFLLGLLLFSCNKERQLKNTHLADSKRVANKLAISIYEISRELQKLRDLKGYNLTFENYEYIDSGSWIALRTPLNGMPSKYLYACKSSAQPEKVKLYIVRFEPDGASNDSVYSGTIDWYDAQAYKLYGIKYDHGNIIDYREPQDIPYQPDTIVMLQSGGYTDNEGNFFPFDPATMSKKAKAALAIEKFFCAMMECEWSYSNGTTDGFCSCTGSGGGGTGGSGTTGSTGGSTWGGTWGNSGNGYNPGGGYNGGDDVPPGGGGGGLPGNYGGGSDHDENGTRVLHGWHLHNTSSGHNAVDGEILDDYLDPYQNSWQDVIQRLTGTVACNTDTLRKIGTDRGWLSGSNGLVFNGRVGRAFEKNALTYFGLDMYMTSLSYNDVPPIRLFSSPQRAAYSGGAMNKVRPDAVSSAWYSQQGGTGYQGQIINLPDFVFTEVKAVKGTLRLSSNNYQILGELDVLYNIATGVLGGPPTAGKRPVFFLITTSDCTISQDIVDYAYNHGIMLWLLCSSI